MDGMKSNGMPRWVVRLLIILVVITIGSIVIFWFLGSVGSVDDALAADTCPSYVLVSNPVTGGTLIVDRCVDADVTSVTDSDSLSATAASSYGTCRTATRKRTFNNRFGWAMFWVQLRKYWCWSGGRITYRPATSFTHGVTGFGAATQWSDKGQTSKGTWNSPDDWESHSWASAKFVQCAPTPFGCIKLRERNPEVHIYAYGNGTFHR